MKSFVYFRCVWAFAVCLLLAGQTTFGQTIYNVTGGGSYCAGSLDLGVPVGLSGSQLGYTYQLKRNGEDVGLPLAGLAGLPLSFGLQTQAGTYTVEATEVVVLGTPKRATMNGSATVTVNQPPTAAAINVLGQALVCPGLSVDLVVNVTGGTGPYTIEYVAVQVLGGGNLLTLGTYTKTNYTPGTPFPETPSVATVYVVTKVTDANGCVLTLPLNPNVGASVNLAPELTLGSVSATETVCQGGKITVTLTGLPVNLPPLLSLQVSYRIGSQTGTAVLNVGGNGVATLDVDLNPALVGPVNLTVEALTLLGLNPPCVKGFTQVSNQINIVPNPQGNGTSVQVCSGTAVNVNLQDRIGNGVASNFTWTVNDNPNVGGESNGSGDNLNQTLTNNSGQPQTVVYTVTPTSEAGSCVGNSFDVTVTVNSGPTASITNTEAQTVCPGGSVTIQGNVTAVGAWTLTLSNGQTVTGTGNGSFSATVNPPNGTTTYSITALTDASGCPAAGGFGGNKQVTVQDNAPPTIATVPNQTATAAAGQNSATVNVTAPSANDNCSGVTVTWSAPGATPSSGTGDLNGVQFPVGTTTVTFTATDGAGNTATSTMTVTVNPGTDTTPPTITQCPSPRDVNLGDNCQITIPSLTGEAQGTDNAGGVTFSQLPAAGSVVTSSNNQVVTVTITATDAAGNTSTCTVNLTAKDTTPPSIATVSNQTATAAAGQNTAQVNVTAPSANDNCPGVTVTWNASGANPSSGTGDLNGVSFPVGTTTVTFTATDAAGNTATSSMTVTVNQGTDTTPPTITQCPAPRDVNLGENCQITVPSLTGEAQGTDNAGGVTFSQLPAAGSVVTSSNNQVVTVTITATDGAGNTATCTVNLTAKDTTPPSIATVPNQTATAPVGQSSATVNVTAPSANDNCPGVTVTWSANGANPSSGSGNLTNVSFPVGTTTVAFTATDAAGNTATSTMTVTVNQGTDTTPPTITQCPAPRDVNLGDNCQITVPNLTGEAQGTDNAGNVTFSQSPAAGSVVTSSNNQVVTVTITATDAAGNTSTCTVNLTAKDTTPPSIATVPNQTATAPVGQSSASVNVTAPSANDNCPGVTVTWSANGANPSSGTGDLNGVQFPLGTTTVTFTATDAAGNTATSNMSVTVNQGSDTTPPTITQCPSPRDVNLGENCQITIPSLTGEAQGTDNAGNVTFSQSPAAGSVVTSSNNQVVTVTITATDAAGNTSTCTVNLTAKDTTPPSIATVPNQTATAAVGQNSASVNVTAPSANDNCPGVTVTWSANGANPSSGTGDLNGVQFPLGTTTVTFTATDGAGNTATSTTSVTVNQGSDTTPPTITQCPTPRDVNLGDNCQITVPNLTGEAQGTDNAGNVTFSQSPAAGSAVTSSNNQVVTVTITATDAAGNTSTCTVNLTAKDITAPSIATVPNQTTTAVVGQNTASVNVSAPSASDNCPGVTVTWSASGANPSSGSGSLSGVSFPVGTTTVTFTATDAAGNTATSTMTVTVTASSCPAPVIAGQPSSTTVCPGSDATFTVNATGTGLSYQWRKGTTNLSDGILGLGEYAGTSTATLTVKNARPDDAGEYNVVITNACGQTVSENASLAVINTSYTLSTNANAQVLCLVETDLNVTLSGSQVGVDYQLFLGDVPVGGPQPGTGSSLTFLDVQVGSVVGAQVFTVRATRNGVTCPVGSSVNVNIGGSPTAFNVTGGGTFCAGGAGVTIGLSGSQKDVRYSLINTATGNVLTTFTCETNGGCGPISFGTITASGTYKVRASYKSDNIVDLLLNLLLACPTDMNGTVSVTVGDGPTAAVLSGGATICPGGTANLSVQVTGGSGPYTVVYNPGNVTVNNYTSGSNIPVNPSTTTTYSLVSVTGAGSCTTTNVSGSATVTVGDTTPPTIATVPNQTATVPAGQSSAQVNVAAPSASDNCSGVTVTWSAPGATPSSGTGDLNGVSFPVGTTTVTFTATDAVGNTATSTMTVTVNQGTDTTPPTITQCPTPRDVNLGDNCQITIPNLTGEAQGTDNAGNVTFSQLPAAGSVVTSSNNQVVTVTITATDAAGNTSTCTVSLTAKDTTPPSIATVPNQTATAPVGQNTAQVNVAAPSASDNCPGVTVTWSATGANPASGTGSLTNVSFPVGTTTVTFTATDAAGNTATSTMTVTVNQGTDTTPPTITQCPAPRDVNLSADCQITIPNLTGEAQGTDNAGGVTFSQSPAAGSVVTSSNNQVVTVTITATDAAGNTATCTVNLTAKDITAPSIATVPNQTATAPVGQNSASVNVTAPSANDNCSGVTVTWTATGANPSSGSGNLTNVSFPVGTTTVTFTATDVAGNTATSTMTVTVNQGTDTTPPTITQCPAPRNVNLSAECQITIPNLTGEAQGTDNAGSVTFSQLPAAGSVVTSSNNQVVTVTITATDGAGNTATCTVNLTAKDITPPSIATVPNQTATAPVGQNTAAVNVTAPSASDNCSGVNVTWSASGANPSSGSGSLNGVSFPVGTTTVTFTATDAAGNTATSTMTVTVNQGTDTTPPVITQCPAPREVNLGDNCQITVPNLTGEAQGTDNAGNVTFSQSPAAGSVVTSSNNQVVTVTITATDAAGNTSTCTVNLTAKDTTPPTLGPVSNQTAVAPAGQNSVAVNVPAPTATDNCPGVTVTWTANGANPSSGTGDLNGVQFPVGTTTVTFTATDASGNTATTSLTVTVNQSDDTTPPVVTCPTPQASYTADAGQCSATLSFAAPTASDNVTPSGQLQVSWIASGATPASGSGAVNGVSFPKGSTTVVYTVRDAAGNQTTCQFTVVVIDNQPPVFGPVSNQTATAPAGQNSAAVNVPAPTATDNCPGVTVTWTATGANPSSGTGDLNGVQFPVGTTTVTFTATDASGNTVTTSLTVTVNQGTDTTPPTITQCPAPRNVNLSADCQITVPNLTGEAQGTDNAGGVTFSQLPAAGSVVTSSNNQVVTVTITATDAAGNTSTCTVNLTAKDTTPPSIATVPNQTATAPVGQSSATVNVSAPSANDNCPGVTVTWTATGANPASGSGSLNGVQFPLGTTTVTFTATDGSGNTATSAMTVTVNQGSDTTPPTITQCPAPRDVNLGDNCQITIPSLTGEAQGTDNAGGVTFSQLPAAGSVVTSSNNQVVTVTITATDAAGNTATCTVNLTAKDSTPPSIATVPNQTATAPVGQSSAQVNVAAPSASDNCSGVTVTWTATGANPSSGSGNLTNVSFPVGTTTVTFTATDAAGNTATSSMTVTVNQGSDTTPPTITQCPTPRDVNLGDNCQITVPNLTGEAQGTDNAGGVTFSQSPAAGSVVTSSNNQVVTVTITATDAAGNTSTCTVNLTAKDTTPPSIATVPNQTATAPVGQNTASVNVSAPAANDNCPGVTVTWTATGANPASGTGSLTNVSFPVGTTTVTFTATDGAGNTATSTMTVTVNQGSDTTPPTITQCPAPRDVNLSADCQITVPNLTGEAQGTDNAGGVTFTQSPAAGSVVASSNNQVVTVTITATDGAGNTATCTVSLTAKDTTPPTIGTASNQTVTAPAGQNTASVNVAAPAASDNCPGVTVTWTATGATPASGNGSLNGVQFPVGTTTVTFTATDAAGNQTQSSATVTVQANTQDTTPPVITKCPPAREVSIGANCQVTIPSLTGEATGTDNAGNVTFAQSPAAGSLVNASNNQVVTVTITATDASGNTSTCTVSLTAKDTTPPSIATVPNQTATAAIGQNTAAVNVAAPSASDNCSGVTVTWTATGANPSSGTGSLTNVSFPVGTTTVTFTATDAAGNTATSSMTVTVNQGTDTTPPTITQCPAPRNVSLGADCQITVPNLTGEAQGTDNAGGVTFTQSPAAGSLVNASNNQVVTVTITATDGSGNTATCTVSLTAKDTTPPTFGPASNQTAVAPIGQNTVAVNVTAPSTSDNCPGVTVTWTATGTNPSSGTGNPTGVQFPVGTTTVTFTATDGSGNTATTSLTVTVTQGSDTTPPTVTCPAPQASYNADGGQCSANLSFAAPTASDNVTPGGQLQITWSAPGATPASGNGSLSGVAFPTGSTTVTYTVRDAAGNQATCQFTVTVVDNQPPVFTAKASDASVPFNTNGTVTIPNLAGQTTATDNCPGVVVTQSPQPGTQVQPGSGGTTTVTVTATDGSGNQVTYTVTITGTQNADTTPPVITKCPPAREVELGANCQVTIPNLTGEATGTDNAGGVTFTQSPAAGSLVSASDNQALTVTLTAKDAAGNTTTCTVTLTARDNTPPVFGPVTNITVAAQPNQAFATVDVPLPTVTDNCPVRVLWTAPGATPSSGMQALNNVRFPVGTTTVTFTALGQGNSSQVSLTVTVTSNQDTTPPTITKCPAAREVTLGANCQLTVPNLTGEATGTDNAGGVTFTQVPAAGSVVASGHNQTVTVTLTATDAAGNTATCTTVLTGKDTTPPVVTQQATSPAILPLNGSGQFAVPNFTEKTVATDNCGPVTVTQSPETGATVKPGENGQATVTVTVADANGNRTSYTVTLATGGKDTTPPTIVACATPVFNTDSGKCYATISFVAPVVTDDRPGTVGLAWTAPGAKPASGTGSIDDVQFPKGTTNVTYTATDSAGNKSSTCAFTVVVVDKRKPVFLRKAPSPFVVKLNSNGQIAIPDLVAKTVAVDNCSPVKLDQSPRVDSLVKFVENGLYAVTVTARDSSGNTASYLVTLTTRDTTNTSTARLGACPPDLSTYRTDLDRCYATLSFGAPVADSDSVQVAWSARGATPASGRGNLTNVRFPKDTTLVFFTVTRKGAKADTVCRFRVVVVDNPAKAGTVAFTPGFPTLLSHRPGQDDDVSTSLTVTDHTGVIVRWESAPLATGTWRPVINTAGRATIDVQNLTQTTYYRVVVQDSACGNAVASQPFPVTVYKTGLVILKQPVDRTVCEGEQGYFHTMLSPSLAEEKTTVMKWETRRNASAPWTDAPGPNTAEAYHLQTGATALTASGTQFRMRVTHKDSTYLSDVVTLTVVPTAAMLQQPQSVAVDAGAEAVLAAVVTGGNLRYQWQRASDKADTVFVDLKNQPGKMSGATSPVLRIANVRAAKPDMNRYRLVVYAPCGTMHSTVVTVSPRTGNQGTDSTAGQVVTALPVTAAQPQAMEERVEVFPNPVPNGLTLKVRVPDAGAKLYLFNPNGLPETIVAERTEPGVTEVKPVRQLPTGTYYLKVETNRGVYTRKVLME